ncbi:MAG: CAAX prenyl protease-related protein [Acidobacteriia bacterium]|nr:CAAX prenyl protease-related protein [Terriglobia bacterium]
MPPPPSSSRLATAAYVAPFGAFVSLMQLERAIALPPQVFYPIRFVAVLLILLLVSRRFVSLRPSFPLASIGLGMAVFLIWIGPDILFGYRDHWLFRNFMTGSAVSSLPASLQRSDWFTITRTLSSAALVPILEELFWRGWLMRWLIHPEFQKVPLGQYAPAAFWIVVVLFASEHGAYWDVGLVAGVIYGWWMVRSKSLADCILAHAVTNALLSAYVLIAGQWQYWL